MTSPLSLTDTAARLSAVAADLAAALADEEADPLAPLPLLDRAADLVEVLSWGMCREPATFPLGGLREIARTLLAGPFPAAGTGGRDGAGVAAVLLAGQPGAGRPGCGPPGQERRGGTAACDFADQAAGVLLAAAVLAEKAGVDLDAAVARRVAALRTEAADR